MGGVSLARVFKGHAAPTWFKVSPNEPLWDLVACALLYQPPAGILLFGVGLSFLLLWTGLCVLK